MLEDDFAIAFYEYPVNKAYLLLTPKRHVEQYVDLTLQERSAIDPLVFEGNYMFEGGVI